MYNPRPPENKKEAERAVHRNQDQSDDVGTRACRIDGRLRQWSQRHRQRNQLVWEGAASGRVTDRARENLEQSVNVAITEIFAQFP